MNVPCLLGFDKNNPASQSKLPSFPSHQPPLSLPQTAPAEIFWHFPSELKNQNAVQKIPLCGMDAPHPSANTSPYAQLKPL